MKKKYLIITLAVTTVVGIYLGIAVKPTGSTEPSNVLGDSIENEQNLLQTAEASKKSELTGQMLELAKARDEQRLSDIRKLQTALAKFQEEHQSLYPAELSELAPKYLEVLPKDPQSGEHYTYTPIGSGPYFYDLSYTMEVGINEIDAGDHVATPNGLAQP